MYAVGKRKIWLGLHLRKTGITSWLQAYIVTVFQLWIVCAVILLWRNQFFAQFVNDICSAAVSYTFYVFRSPIEI